MAPDVLAAELSAFGLEELFVAAAPAVLPETDAPPKLALAAPAREALAEEPLLEDAPLLELLVEGKLPADELPAEEPAEESLVEPLVEPALACLEGTMGLGQAAEQAACVSKKLFCKGVFFSWQPVTCVQTPMTNVKPRF